jgi:hypothetical protein
MFRTRTTSSTLAAAGLLLLALSLHPARAQPAAAVVGILEGQATLVRQTSRHALAEGAELKNDDILETAPASFVQIELPGGHRIGLGPGTRVMLAPGPLRRGAVAPRLYLLQGWAKFTPGTEPQPAGAVDLTPSVEIGAGSGTVIVSSGPKEFAAFAETGTLKLIPRPTAKRPPLSVAAGEFVVALPGEKPVVSSRPPAAFLDQMPRPFRDPLPARAERFKGRQITLKALGDVGYDDIAPWLTAEPGLRVPMLPRWRVRLRDKAFRDAVIARMAAHPEWDPVVFPDKYAPKKKDKDKEKDKEKEHAQ